QRGSHPRRPHRGGARRRARRQPSRTHVTRRDHGLRVSRPRSRGPLCGRVPVRACPGAGPGNVRRVQRVKVEGTKELDAPAALVWAVLEDPARMAKLLPGVESFEVQDADHWSAAVKVPLGMGGLKLKFQFEQVEKRPLEYAKLSAKGQGVGAMVNMVTEFH